MRSSQENLRRIHLDLNEWITKSGPSILEYWTDIVPILNAPPKSIVFACRSPSLEWRIDPISNGEFVTYKTREDSVCIPQKENFSLLLRVCKCAQDVIAAHAKRRRSMLEQIHIATGSSGIFSARQAIGISKKKLVHFFNEKVSNQDAIVSQPETYRDRGKSEMISRFTFTLGEYGE